MSPSELFSDEADFARPIPTHEVREVRIRRRIYNPLMLIVPTIAAVLAVLVGAACIARPLEAKKIWLLLVPLFLAGYAVHALWCFVVNRRYVVEVVAPMVRAKAIIFYARIVRLTPRSLCAICALS